jgi:hypothetical protein
VGPILDAAEKVTKSTDSSESLGLLLVVGGFTAGILFLKGLVGLLG